MMRYILALFFLSLATQSLARKNSQIEDEALASLPQTEADWVALQEDDGEDDVTSDQLDKHSGTGGEAFQSLMKYKESGRKLLIKNNKVDGGVPLAYSNMAAANEKTMFDETSDPSNPVEVEDDSRGKRQIPVTDVNFCPHVNYLLTWFPWFGPNGLNICFVPWAGLQGITYARCTQPTCVTRWSWGQPWQNRGRCRPACYQRRRVLAFCWSTTQGGFTWRWVIRSLPQACQCSTC